MGRTQFSGLGEEGFADIVMFYHRPEDTGGTVCPNKSYSSLELPFSISKCNKPQKADA